MAKEIFINFTNHPSEKWGDKQLSAAKEYGDVVDIPFPEVSPAATKEEIYDLALKCVNKIVELRPAAVLCQGEFTLCYSVITGLKEKGIKVMAACSRRMVQDTENGKITVFVFEGFREY